MTEERRDITFVELEPGKIALLLRQIGSDDHGYVLRRGIGQFETVLLYGAILAPASLAMEWLVTLVSEPWELVCIEGVPVAHPGANVALPDREGGWPQ